MGKTTLNLTRAHRYTHTLWRHVFLQHDQKHSRIEAIRCCCCYGLENFRDNRPSTWIHPWNERTNKMGHKNTKVVWVMWTTIGAFRMACYLDLPSTVHLKTFTQPEVAAGLLFLVFPYLSLSHGFRYLRDCCGRPTTLRHLIEKLSRVVWHLLMNICITPHSLELWRSSQYLMKSGPSGELVSYRLRLHKIRIANFPEWFYCSKRPSGSFYRK